MVASQTDVSYAVALASARAALARTLSADAPFSDAATTSPASVFKGFFLGAEATLSLAVWGSPCPSPWSENDPT